jgi:hypothetical protein
MHNSSMGFTLICTLCYECAFMCRSWMKTSRIRVSLTRIPCYPYDGLERYNDYA